MKHIKVVLALLLVLSLGLGMTNALAEDGLTTVTVLGYNQGSALMGSFENSYAYEWLQEQMTALGIDLQIEYVEADQYSCGYHVPRDRQCDAEQPDQSRHAYQRG